MRPEVEIYFNSISKEVEIYSKGSGCWLALVAGVGFGVVGGLRLEVEIYFNSVSKEVEIYSESSGWLAGPGGWGCIWGWWGLEARG